MGQKVNPISMRLGINRTWDSTWYAGKNEYSILLKEDLNMRKMIFRDLKNAAISRVVIERPHKKCLVTIHSGRPGLIIGKKGSEIENLRKKLQNLTLSDVVVNIVEVRKPEINATLVAENIAQQLERRVGFRKAMKRSVQSAMRLGAKGIKVTLSGRLAGNEIARTEWLREGSIPLHTLRANLDYAEAEALTTYGVIGVKVWIYKGELFLKDVEKEKIDRIKNASTNKNKI